MGTLFWVPFITLQMTINLTKIEKSSSTKIDAFIFDLDGLLIKSEEYWDEARKKFVKKRGGSWQEKDQKNVMGLNSKEWARYIKKKIAIKEPEKEIIEEVKKLILSLYKTKGIPFISEAVSLLKILARKRIPPHKKCYSIAIATSSPKEIADFILKKSNLNEYVSILVSSDEVRHGKPYPDVYLKVTELLNEKPRNILVFEDSPNGVKAAKAAGMIVIAIPNKKYKFNKGFEAADFMLNSIAQFNAL